MFVLLFGVLTALVQSALKAFLPPLALTALSGILELSGGAGALAELALAQGVKFTLASMLLAFGGLSVHAQTRAVLTPTGAGQPSGFPAEAAARLDRRSSQYPGLPAV